MGIEISPTRQIEIPRNHQTLREPENKIPSVQEKETTGGHPSGSHTEAQVIEAIEHANNAFRIVNTRFEFSIHEETKAIMVKVIDEDTQELIREIPPERILDLVAKMWELAGIILDERA